MTKKKNKKAKADAPKVALIAGGDEQASSKKGKKSKKADGKAGAADGKQHGGLDGLFRLAEHPLVADLIAVGALAAVAAIAEAGRDEPAAAKSGKAAKAAGKAAAAAIGARLLKEVTGAKKGV